MRNKLNEEIVSALRDHLPQDVNIIPYLMDLLSLGKESIYRRLRSEIPFTFEEIAIISSKVGFSIDSLVKLKKTERVLFDVELFNQSETEDFYHKKMMQYVQFFAETRKSSIVINRFAKNYIPYSFSLYFDSITKFRYYRWIHQTLDVDPDFAMSDLLVPQRITDLQNQWKNAKRDMINATYIFDDNIFLSMVRDIDYFYKRRLIKDFELQRIQEELLQMIDTLEKVAKDGRSHNGAEVSIYLLQLDLGAAYSHTEYGDNVASYIQMHSIDVLKSVNPRVCEVQKNWLELLKRYSVLITRSGEIQRFEYFDRQRKYILNAGKNMSN